MSRRGGQIFVLLSILALVIVVVYYQSALQSQLKGDVLNQYGYSYLDASPAQSKVQVNGITEFRYLVQHGQKVILDGLQASQQVPNFQTEAKWSAVSTNSAFVTIDDSSSVRTFFMAPSQDVDLQFLLEVRQNGSFTPVARYVFSVVSPVAFSADADKDGKYTFMDLTLLLQNWNSLGSSATQVLSVILSKYQD